MGPHRAPIGPLWVPMGSLWVPIGLILRPYWAPIGSLWDPISVYLYVIYIITPICIPLLEVWPRDWRSGRVTGGLAA